MHMTMADQAQATWVGASRPDDGRASGGSIPVHFEVLSYAGTLILAAIADPATSSTTVPWPMPCAPNSA